jgi:phage terminase Nu1 subunit (DNA packaging protein)
VAKKDTRAFVRTLGEIAEIFDVSADTVKRWRTEGMPGTTQRYVLQDVTRWLRTEGPWKPYSKSQATSSAEDPLLAGGDSPGLERYRLAKAKHAELDLEHRKGELIEKEKAKAVLSRWAWLIRQMGERLAKRYGNDVAITINDTLAECRRAVQEVVNDES